ncbi:TPX2 [Lepeophtheirus salmonis]|uniref:TPX2 n=1 Tax=Lepeophtheirus salmonis TaxID=72036 RepID=A0A7R8CFA7_LEPSM|nr:TPX2 [Lepeophtheirus salmonis]CAF2804872.1 TPX2 [Lepeophtheirus salmonis]
MKEHIMPTRIEPFNLDVNRKKRVEARLKKWEENLEQESRKQKEATKFKAKPAKLGMPFVPAPSNKPLVEISNFELHTDRRAQDREVFELHIKEKEVEILELKRMREDQKKMEEEEEIRRLRKEAVHKSNPIRNYPPIVIHPSDKPMTQPKKSKFRFKEMKLLLIIINMDLSCEYDDTKLVEFELLKDDSLKEKNFDIDHECKSMFLSSKIQVPKIEFTYPTDEEKDESFVQSIKKNQKIKYYISDKRALTKVIANSSTFSDINSEQVSGTTSTRRLSNGKVAKVVSSKISKTFRRTSIGNSNKKEEKSSSNTFGNCFKRVIQTQSSKENTTNKPLKAHPASSFTFNKMIKSYQDRRESKLTESPKVSGLKNIKQRSSNIFSRLTRDSSVGDKDRNKPTLSYVPMAEMIMKLENTTPDRYRTLPNRGRSQNINPSLTRSRSNSSKRADSVVTLRPHMKLYLLLYPKIKKPQRKVCSSESVNSVQSQASCSNIPKTKSVTKIQPFSFDPKIAESEAKKALKFKEVLEKESKDRKFKATSIPNFHKPINLPIKECTIPTIVEPFNLDIESRLEARIKKREENLKLEEKKQKRTN